MIKLKGNSVLKPCVLEVIWLNWKDGRADESFWKEIFLEEKADIQLRLLVIKEDP